MIYLIYETIVERILNMMGNGSRSQILSLLASRGEDSMSSNELNQACRICRTQAGMHWRYREVSEIFLTLLEEEKSLNCRCCGASLDLWWTWFEMNQHEGTPYNSETVFDPTTKCYFTGKGLARVQRHKSAHQHSSTSVTIVALGNTRETRRSGWSNRRKRLIKGPLGNKIWKQGI